MRNLAKIFAVLFCICGTNSFAQFPTLKWQYNIGAPAFGSAASADLDKDGFYEIVFSTYTNDGKVHCLNAEDGSVKWIYDIKGCGDVAPLIVDVDADDTLDVVVNGSCNPTVFCINGITGKLKWSKSSGGGDSPPTAADVDGDGKMEILFCNFSGQLRILNGEDGSSYKTIQVEPNKRTIQTEPTLVDVNNDGKLDVIMANYFNKGGLYIWAYDIQKADTIWTNYNSDSSSSFSAYHGGAIADVDADGKMEYVIGSNNGLVRALNVEDGSVLWTVMIPKSNMAPISIADLNNDGDLEVVVTNNDWITFDERIWVLDGLTGQEEWSYKTTFSSFRGCAIADINGNDTLDLVAGYYMGDVIAVEPYTGLLWKTNLKSYLPSGLPYFDVNHGPLVADFDKNGKMDVFVVVGYGTYTPDSQNCGKAIMLEAGKGQCPEWLMFRQDIQRSGFLSAQDIKASCDKVMTIQESPFGKVAVELWPNPSQEYIYIKCDGKFDFEIFDSQGKLIKSASQNTDQLKMETCEFAPGLYIIVTSTQKGKVYNKIVVER
ncbi:MAG: FG-GAP-like repeat-containing protein [Bacteroidota bacterium]|nr:FG-GAP-like repeat-containing protein [Bacteroidota bacterium]